MDSSLYARGGMGFSVASPKPVKKKGGQGKVIEQRQNRYLATRERRILR
jgi:hypothetical protein